MIESLNNLTTAFSAEEFWPTENVATRPLKMSRQNESFYYFHDGNKNVTSLTDEAGNLVQNYNYKTFGAVESSSEQGNLVSAENSDAVESSANLVNPLQFSSEYYDSELNLVYYNYRHDDLETGRFLSKDPIAEQDSVNLYLFVKNRSINYIDKLGLKTYVNIYYEEVTDSFKRAAETIARNRKNKEFNPDCDQIITRGIRTSNDFKNVWDDIKDSTDGDNDNFKIQEMHILTHSGNGSIYLNNGSINNNDISNLPQLNWNPKGFVVLHGCNSGVCSNGEKSLAENFTNSQTITAYGTTGYSQFSTNMMSRTIFSRINDNSKDVYLWSYGSGGKNFIYGGWRIPTISRPASLRRK